MTSARMEITSATAWGCLLSCRCIALPNRAEGHSFTILLCFLLLFYFVLFLSQSFFSPLLFLPFSLNLTIFPWLLSCLFFSLLTLLSGSPPSAFSWKTCMSFFPPLSFCTVLKSDCNCIWAVLVPLLCSGSRVKQAPIRTKSKMVFLNAMQFAWDLTSKLFFLLSPSLILRKAEQTLYRYDSLLIKSLIKLFIFLPV